MRCCWERTRRHRQKHWSASLSENAYWLLYLDYSSLVPGGDNRLSVVLGIYHPNVQCRGTFGPERTSCRDIVGDMPADETSRIFGPQGDPRAQQKLPMVIESCMTVCRFWTFPILTPFAADEKCVAQIYTTGKSDVTVWYRVWEAVNAVYSICVRAGYGGSVRGLGE